MSTTPALQSRIGAALFLGQPLHLTALTLALHQDTGQEINRYGDNGYQRVNCDPGPAWNSTQDGDKTRFYNQAPVIFPAPTRDWGTVTALSLHDASSDEVLATFALDAPRVIEAGDNPPVFLAGELVFDLG